MKFSYCRKPVWISFFFLFVSFRSEIPFLVQSFLSQFFDALNFHLSLPIVIFNLKSLKVSYPYYKKHEHASFYDKCPLNKKLNKLF